MRNNGLKFLLIALIACSFSTIKAQEQTLCFKTGDRVCFVGNSITHAGYYWSYIVLYYATRFPDRQIEFFNCGISGDIADGVLRRMDYDILSNKPTVATLMIGMNDVRRNDYKPSLVANKVQHEKRVAETLATYEHNITQINQILSNKTQSLVLLTPSIYDQTSSAPTTNLKGSNDGLHAFGELIKREAPKYKAKVVDFWGGMNHINSRLQQCDPEASIIGKDRIHPGPEGGMVMAYQFLKDTRMPKTVSSISIDTKKKIAKSENGTLANIQTSRQNVSFDFTAKALPFPMTESMDKYTNLYPFHKELNQETLTVSGLNKGQYRLSIEGKEISLFSSMELQMGINLAQNNQTPQYNQAITVLQTVERFRNHYSSYRGLLLVEHSRLKDFAHIQNIDSCIAQVARLYDKEVNKETYMPKQYKFYIENKKRQQQIWDEVRELNKTIYRTNTPTSYSYQLTKVK